MSVRTMVVVGSLWLLATGCRCSVSDPANDAGADLDAGLEQLAARTVMQAPATPKGMVWVPPGALVAGTPPAQVPRKADQEMPGEQVYLEGFFIDEFAYPNEEGAIPRTSVTQQDARDACEKEGKRLCTELEWERACKGPRNSVYEYGNRYQEAMCRTGAATRPLPSGYLFSCRSEFGVHDMHGAIWEWTDSAWGRGTKDSRVALRGGNGDEGEVVGRCANARPESASAASPTIGFRCCSGTKNAAEVSLSVVTGPALRLINMPDRKLMTSLEGRLPEEVAQSMKQRGVFRMAHLWEWRPIANEDLIVVGGCAGAPPARECGVLIVRRTLGRLDVLDWVSSGHFVPTIRLKYDPLKIWVYGGDRRSHYRKPIRFGWGRIQVGAPIRNSDDK